MRLVYPRVLGSRVDKNIYKTYKNLYKPYTTYIKHIQNCNFARCYVFAMFCYVLLTFWNGSVRGLGSRVVVVGGQTTSQKR